jgi:hypothetical protein
LLLVSPLLWSNGWFYQLVTLGQVFVYGCGVLGWQLGHTKVGRMKIFAVPFFFCMVNAASLLAAWNMVRGHRIDRWEPQRKTDSQESASRPSDRTVVPRSELA